MNEQFVHWTNESRYLLNEYKCVCKLLLKRKKEKVRVLRNK